VSGSSEANSNSHTEFKSAPVLITSPQCLSFDYRLTGSGKNNSELRVLLSEVAIDRQTVVWQFTKLQTNWVTAYMELNPKLNPVVKVWFQARYAGDLQSTVSIDNIAVSPGGCPFTRESY